MPAPYGLVATGFSEKTLEEIKDDLETAMIAAIDPKLDVSSDTPIGQEIGIISGKLRELWELGSAIYAAFSGNAGGVGLTNVAALTGSPRKDPTASTAVIKCNLDGGTALTAGNQVSQSGNSNVKFQLNANFTAPVGPAADYNLDFTCTVTGPTSANSGTLTVIDTPISGWNSATNDSDAVIGTDIESDVALRNRREKEVRGGGAANVDSILSAVDKITNVQEVLVRENVTDATDGSGIPAKSFYVVLYDSPAVANDTIAQAIWDSKPAGIRTHGALSGTATDIKGNSQTMNFARATVRNIYLEIDVDINALDYPVDGDTKIKEALVALGDSTYNIGSDVIASALKAQGFIAGVVDVTALRLGFSVSPTGTANLAITDTELADLDTSRVVVATTPV